MTGCYLPRRPPTADECVVRGMRTHLTRWAGHDPQPIVLLHGFMDTGDTFQFLVDALPDGYSFVAPDWRGFGRSGWPTEGYWFQDYFGDLDALLDGLSLAGPVTLVGHSMGGNVLSWFAVRYPDRLERAVLVDAATGPASTGGGSGLVGGLLRLPNVRRIGQLVLRTQLDEARMAEILRSAYADPSRVTEETLAGYVAPLQTVDWDLGLLAILRDSGDNDVDTPIGEVLDVPTAIIWGREDPWIPLSSGEALRDALPGAEWHIIDDAGHLPMEEQPAAFNDILIAWLESTR